MSGCSLSARRSACTSSLSTFPWMLISTPVSALPGSLAEDVAAENDFCAALAKASTVGSPHHAEARGGPRAAQLGPALAQEALQAQIVGRGATVPHETKQRLLASHRHRRRQ